jgi:Tfp pilus assembly protein PilV
MAKRPLIRRLSERRKRSGVALIVVLFAVALISIAVLAFFNFAILNRSTSFSSAGQARANILALSALTYVKGDFIAEIQNGSTLAPDLANTGVPIYQPTTNATMLPYRMTASIAPADPTIPANLLKWSSGLYSLWPANTAYNAAGPIRGSIDPTTSQPVSTSQPSLNGRFVANNLWTEPDFGTSATFPNSVVPQWVYMTRQGPLTNSVPLASLTSANSTNLNYVVGRYAYTVYDEGGLVDVMAAGYSPSTFATDPTDVGRKGNQGFADLTQIGLTSQQVDQLVSWRNASSWNSTSAYVGYLGTNAAPLTNAPSVGFLQAAAGDQAFVGRQDLIQYWNNKLGASPSLLPYITTFSREKNAPSWGPEHNANDPASSYWTGTNVTLDPTNLPTGQISYAYHDNENVATVNVTGATQPVHNRFFPGVRVTTPFTRLNGQSAVPGEPLVGDRFDLNKLSWVTYNNVAPIGITSTDIYHYFGLTWNSTDNSWIYNHSTVTPPSGVPLSAPQIMTLDLVSAAGREPDFFELLQATILQGSMGLASGDPTQATNNGNSGSGGEYYRLAEGTGASFTYEAPLVRADTDATQTHLSLVYGQDKYQIIQIGANMIDQADTDNFPTDIVLNSEHIYGVENLPYINAMGDCVLRPAPGTISPSPPDATFSDPYQQYVHHWLTFSLWNPHQNAAFPPTNGPTKLRIAVTAGEEYPNYNNAIGGYSTPNPVAGSYMGRVFEAETTSGSVTPITSISSPTSMQGPAWIGIIPGNYPNHFSEPTPIGYNSSLSFTSDTDNPATSNMNDGYGRISSSNGWQRAGVYLGYSKSPENPYKVPLCAGINSYYANYIKSQLKIPQLGNNLPGLFIQNAFTIELQYEDPQTPGPSHWHTYQVFRGAYPDRGSGSGDAYMETNDPAWQQWTMVPPNDATSTPPVPGGYSNPNGYTVAQIVGGATTPEAALQPNQEYWANYLLDPRTARLNVQVIHSPSTSSGLMTTALGQSTAVLPGADAGVPPSGHFPKASVSKTAQDAPNNWLNNQTTTVSYYLDRDFIQRVGDAAGWAGASPVTSGALTQRPFHLDRSFRSVAELGYVFRDDPWKTLNFISANSADAGLLDIFYIGTRPNTPPDLPPPDMIGARMNLNSVVMNSIAAGSTSSLPLQSLLSAGLRDYLTTDPATINNSIAATDAATLASNLIAYIKAHGPLMNISDLPAVFPQDTSFTTANPGLKGQREGAIRALADGTGTRTWNLMIDVVAQAGKLSATASSLSNFTVEGEKHYWLHVAIDRFTGAVVDEQLEPVWN